MPEMRMRAKMGADIWIRNSLARTIINTYWTRVKVTFWITFDMAVMIKGSSSWSVWP